MIRILTILFCFSLCLACSDDEVTTPVNTQTRNCTLEVRAIHCLDFDCDSFDPVEDQLVEFYKSFDSAVNGIDPIVSLNTDSDGRIISPLNCESFFIKIVTENFGTYIGLQRFTLQTIRAEHIVRFVDGYVYEDDEDLTLVQRHISLENPGVGQVSRYKYHSDRGNISFAPTEYTPVELEVKIVDQLDANRFVVQENIDSIYGILQRPTFPEFKQITTVWRFENDSLFVEQYLDFYFGSFIWNLSEWYPQENGIGFSLNRNPENELDLSAEGLDVQNVLWKFGSAADFELLGSNYVDVIVENTSYISFDGSLKFRMYSKKDGLIRSFDFFNGTDFGAVHGFDLMR